MLAATEKKFTLTKGSKFDSKTQIEADRAMREQDRVTRWRKVHDLLRKHNKKARKEQDAQAKAMAEVRRNKVYDNHIARRGNLRFGVSIPNITWQALVEADILVTGESVLKDPKKDEYLDKKATNKIVRDLAKAFPQYKASEK